MSDSLTWSNSFIHCGSFTLTATRLYSSTCCVVSQPVVNGQSINHKARDLFSPKKIMNYDLWELFLNNFTLLFVVKTIVFQEKTDVTKLLMSQLIVFVVVGHKPEAEEK